MQKVFYGPQKADHPIKDLTLRESLILGSLVVVIFFLGLFPQSVMKMSAPSVDRILKTEEISGNTVPDENNTESNVLVYDSN